MNHSLVMFSALRRGAAVAVLTAGSLLGTSCSPYAPTSPDPTQPTGPFRYGYGGTNSPNYDQRANPGHKEIKRDPNDDNVNIEPPPSGNNPPPAEANPGTPPPPTTPPVTDTPPPTTKPSALEDLPYGIPVVGKKGFVYSPYAEDRGLVDVEGMKRGTRVECPYTKKHFRVP